MCDNDSKMNVKDEQLESASVAAVKRRAWARLLLATH